MNQTDVDCFEEHRDMLQGLAYRLLGTVAEAEDAVQETYLRWLAADHDAIVSPRAWLVKVCTRYALDQLKSARKKREQYVGPWLPEPWVVSRETPFDKAQWDETISMALLATLERLSPAERATFLLHDVFQFDFEEVSAILDKSPQACRKLATRAREHVRAEKPRFAPDADEHLRLTEAFFAAVQQGDLESLRSLLQEEVTFHSDGGGKASAARRIFSGRDLVCRFFKNVWGEYRIRDDASLEMVWFNGAPGLLVRESGRPVTAMTFAVDGSKIRSIYAIRNPEKLQRLR